MTYLFGLALLIVDAALVAWPLYATWPFLVVTAGAVGLAWLVASVSDRRGFAWYVRVVVAVIAG